MTNQHRDTVNRIINEYAEPFILPAPTPAPRLDPTNKLDASFGVALQRLAARQAAKPAPRAVDGDDYTYTAPAPVASFDLDPDVVADVRADLNDSREPGDGYYSDDQVERALFRFVQSELETLVEDVGNRFFEQPAYRRERFLDNPASRKSDDITDGADDMGQTYQRAKERHAIYIERNQAPE